eukprot:COSAG02_NODE_54844_length_294_cov_0.364103_1_plen_76_part_10
MAAASACSVRRWLAYHLIHPSITDCWDGRAFLGPCRQSACIFDCVLAQQQCRRTLSVLGVCCAVCLCESAHGRGRA